MRSKEKGRKDEVKKGKMNDEVFPEATFTNGNLLKCLMRSSEEEKRQISSTYEILPFRAIKSE